MEEKAIIKRECSLSVVFLLFVISNYVGAAEKAIIRVNVGVVMEESGIGKMGLSCINMALSDFYSSRSASNYKTKLFLHTRNYSNNSDVLQAASSGTHLYHIY